MPVTVYAVATAMARNPEPVAAMNEAGWEIATHGYKWIDYRDTPEDVEARHIAEAVRIHTADRRRAAARLLPGPLVGQHDSGSAGEEGGFLYCADSYADDLPYWIEGPKGPQLIVPYTLTPTTCASQRRRGSIPAISSMPISRTRSTRSTRRARRRRRCCRSACIAALSAGPAAPPRWPASSTMCASHDKVWVATRLDIARHWIRTHPPAGGWKPSRLSRTLFVERFGGVYEHSPWVAEAAFDAGLGPQDDAAEGLARAMARAMAAAGEADKRR